MSSVGRDGALQAFDVIGMTCVLFVGSGLVLLEDFDSNEVYFWCFLPCTLSRAILFWSRRIRSSGLW